MRNDEVGSNSSHRSIVAVVASQPLPIVLPSSSFDDRPILSLCSGCSDVLLLSTLIAPRHGRRGRGCHNALTESLLKLEGDYDCLGGACEDHEGHTRQGITSKLRMMIVFTLAFNPALSISQLE
ncbi:hypothetical protein DL93DRAFT_2071038 [Clavulina sp. PMI_390]|nr:hypothetical protein DL93DRAFT_2071038 [Clavulina sp. PMI_390]